MKLKRFSWIDLAPMSPVLLMILLVAGLNFAAPASVPVQVAGEKAAVKAVFGKEQVELLRATQALGVGALQTRRFSDLEGVYVLRAGGIQNLTTAPKAGEPGVTQVTFDIVIALEGKSPTYPFNQLAPLTPPLTWKFEGSYTATSGIDGGVFVPGEALPRQGQTSFGFIPGSPIDKKVPLRGKFVVFDNPQTVMALLNAAALPFDPERLQILQSSRKAMGLPTIDAAELDRLIQEEIRLFPATEESDN